VEYIDGRPLHGHKEPKSGKKKKKKTHKQSLRPSDIPISGGLTTKLLVCNDELSVKSKQVIPYIS